MEKERVGFYLRRTREVREISLEEISKKTKISVRFLKAIEEGKWSSLPGEVFIKGFIRTYAEVLGLNPEEVIQKYLQEREIKESGFTERKIEKVKNIWEKLFFFLSFVILIGLIILFLPKSKNRESKNSLIEESATPLVEKPKEKTQSLEKLEEKIEILFTRHCWVRAEVDGIKSFEGFKEASQKLEFNFKEKFTLKVGDAGAVQIIRNGQIQPRLGEDGQPVLYKLP